MARPHDPRYADHPLKVLRNITELSQPAFAQMTGLSLDTVRALEIGRRNQGKLSQELLEQIFLSIGASWSEETKQWLFLFTAMTQEPVPYSKEHLQTFREELGQEARERAAVVYYLLLEFLSFCEAIPSPKFNGWFWRLEQLFEQWRKEVQWPTIPWQLDPHWDRKKARVVGYRKMFPSLFEGEEKRFVDLIERARQEHRKQQARSEANFDEAEAIEKAELKRKRGKERQPRPHGQADKSKNT